MEKNFKHTYRETNNPAEDKPAQKVLWVRPYNIKQLAKMYGIHRSTFYRWIEPHKEAIGKKYGHYYNVNQVTTIFNRLDLP